MEFYGCTALGPTLPARRWHIAFAAAVAVTLSALAAAVGYGGSVLDDAHLLFWRWLNGEPLMVVKLLVHAPSVEADACFVAVHRFPSQYNPTESGFTERLYAGFVPPGSTVTVRAVLSAIPVKLTLDESSGRYRVAYYEPQEFAVIISCARGDAAVYEWARVVSVYPARPIHVVEVRPPASSHVWGTGSGRSKATESTAFNCTVALTDRGRGYARGYCYTYVAGPLLYSVEGVSTAFGVCGGIGQGCLRPSAVYLEAFGGVTWCNGSLCSRSGPAWIGAGGKLAPSTVTGLTRPLTCNCFVRLLFRVKYVLEVYEYRDVFSGNAVRYWLFYPSRVTDVIRADTLGVGRVFVYTPPQPPPYATCTVSNVTVWFSAEARETGKIVARTPVAFSYEGRRWVLEVGFYGAGRSDNQYTTPFVEIRAGRAYCWWFKNDDPMSYEVVVSR